MTSVLLQFDGGKITYKLHNPILWNLFLMFFIEKLKPLKHLNKHRVWPIWGAMTPMWRHWNYEFHHIIHAYSTSQKSCSRFSVCCSWYGVRQLHCTHLPSFTVTSMAFGAIIRLPQCPSRYFGKSIHSLRRQQDHRLQIEILCIFFVGCIVSRGIYKMPEFGGCRQSSSS